MARKMNVATGVLHQTVLVTALAHCGVPMGRSPGDRHARSDPAANCQKDKNGKQFPHNRLRSGCIAARKILLGNDATVADQISIMSDAPYWWITNA